jgi:hypothetical protein
MFPHRRSIFAITLWTAAFTLDFSAGAVRAQSETASVSPEAATLRKIYTEALTHGEAFENLRALVTTAPGRLAGSPAYARAVAWGERTLGALQLDRVYKQDLMVPHWERGAKESVTLLPPAGVKGEGVALTAVALGGSVPGNLTAEVIEVKSLEALDQLGREKIAGKIIFFNRPMDPALFNPGTAYGVAGDQRNQGPGIAAKFGAVGALTRSLTHAHDDVPHTGHTGYLPGQPQIPAAALSTLAADKLGAALTATPHAQVHIKINSTWYDDAPSWNVIGEIRGSEFPEQIMVVGGHLDCWDIAPGAHDDGSGIVQSIEVLRIFRTLGIKPRHTLRCVLFSSEENSLNGATAYASAARETKEKHFFAVESDNGGFQPHGFSLGSTQGDAAKRAARWLPLFEPYGISYFRSGGAGADVTPLMVQGVTVGELMPNSQRYFDVHHTTEDSLDKVNPRELHLGAAALASLIWLVDTQGL